MAPGAEVVAVGEAAGHDHGIDAAGSRPSPCHTISPAPPSAVTASTTSGSQFVPGKSTTPTAHADGLDESHERVLDDRVGEEPLDTVRAPRLGGGLVGGVDREPDGLADPHAGARRRTRGSGSERSMVAPCGSAIPSRHRTSTSTSNVTAPM